MIREIKNVNRYISKSFCSISQPNLCKKDYVTKMNFIYLYICVYIHEIYCNIANDYPDQYCFMLLLIYLSIRADKLMMICKLCALTFDIWHIKHTEDALNQI